MILSSVATVRVAFSRPELTPFLKFANGSHHLRLCDYIARLHNTLQPKTTDSQLQLLPELGDIDSGETFGLVMSDHVATFGGLLIKEENIEKGLLDSFDSSVDPTTGEEVDLAFLASRNVIINEVANRPRPSYCSQLKLRGRWWKPPAPKRKAVCISLDSDNEGDASGGTIKKLRTLALPSTEVPSMAPGTGQLDAYFPSVQDNQRCTRKLPPEFSQDRPVLTSAATEDHSVLASTTTEVQLNQLPDQRYTRKLPPEFLQDHPVVASAATEDCPVLASAATEVHQITPDQRYTRKLPPEFFNRIAQCLPALASITQWLSRQARPGLSACSPFPRVLILSSLTFQNSDEFYLFMEMWAEFKWLSYQMTSKRWVLATEEYNRRLTKKKGQSVIQKNPQALLRALGDIEPKLMSKITKNDYTCESVFANTISQTAFLNIGQTARKNSESFWRRHCSVVPLVKEEPGRKVSHLCLVVCTLFALTHQPSFYFQGSKGTDMLPLSNNYVSRTRELAPQPQEGVLCTDGVKQSSKAASEELPAWPQPRGIFSEGRTFHPHVFLSTVQRVYEHVFMQGPGETDLLETEAFSKLLISRTEVHESDNMVLFRLFKGFITDPTTPCDRIVSHDGEEWLRINYLQQ
ncbi:hypothetical protein F4604DRAFT_2036666 [Suillus subluteus]|nr:hypothetical protein F4604DRAFT_2036666 [Suillus subluteus]